MPSILLILSINQRNAQGRWTIKQRSQNAIKKITSIKQALLLQKIQDLMKMRNLIGGHNLSFVVFS